MNAPFARRLRELKERSGRSYAELSSRALTSRSTLHRYCKGYGLPPDPETVIRIGKACDANAAEIRGLLEVWIQRDPRAPASGAVATAAAAQADEGAATERPARVAPPATATGAAFAIPNRVRPPHSPRRRAGAAALGIAVALTLLSAATAEPGEVRGSPAGPPITAPSWAVYPKPVERQWFGATINSDTGQMPSFRLGAVRFWNSRTRWSNLEPERGRFEWETLDRLVAGAERAGLEASYVIGGTPSWAAPDSPPMPFLEKPRATGPDDLKYWDRFVQALVGRYRKRIRAYELWDLANEPAIYSGTPERLVEMTRRATRIIKRAYPEAFVVCPGMTIQAEKPEQMRMVRRFAELGGYRHCDAASVKLSQGSGPPEVMLNSLLAAGRVLHETGTAVPLWYTGPAYSDPLQDKPSEERAANHAARFYLTGLYGREFDMRRMYFYNWGSTKIPVVLQGVGGPPTRAARYVERLQRWLADARIRSCGQGAAVRMPATAWRCEFVIGGRPALIAWTTTGSARIAIPPGANSLHYLDGRATLLQAGTDVTITEQPTLITTSG